MLARLGYVALAADIYGAGVRPGPADAPKVAATFYRDPALVRARAAAGLPELQAHPMVDSTRIAVIGYCFGGFVALELARTGADIAGVVSFHGMLSTSTPKDDAAKIRAKVLVLAGADDPDVSGLERQVGAGQPGHRVRGRNAGGAGRRLAARQLRRGHARFTHPETNAPDHGAAYQAVADRRSWTAMRTFFDEIFG